ncbi:MAG: hypothetical protein ABI740_00700 [Alphaproteobacteria bacterium]
MGGIILVGLVALAVLILIRPALVARARARRERLRAGQPDAVIEHLDDHRKH